jgi:hypothetical protein
MLYILFPFVVHFAALQASFCIFFSSSLLCRCMCVVSTRCVGTAFVAKEYTLVLSFLILTCDFMLAGWVTITPHVSEV